MKDLVVDDKEAIRQYAEKFGECRDGTDAGPNSASLGVTGPGYNRTAFPWFKGPAPKKPDAVPAEASLSKRLRHYLRVAQVLHAALAKPKTKKITKQDLWEVDSEAG